MTQPTDLPAEYATIRAALHVMPAIGWSIASEALAALDRLAARAQEKPAYDLLHDIEEALGPLQTGLLTDMPELVRNLREDLDQAREVPAATDAGASALEAQEQQISDADILQALADVYPKMQALAATPPAPPAAECACKVTMATAGVPLEVLCLSIENRVIREISPELQEALIMSRGMIRAALATPCEHGSEQSEIARLRAELDAEENRTVAFLECVGAEDLELAADKFKRFAAELAQARKATEEAQHYASDFEACWQLAVRDKYELAAELAQARARIANLDIQWDHMVERDEQTAAELRRAVDVMKSCLWAWKDSRQKVVAFVAAYDAKHGEQS